jgi:hypothetical protein
MNFVLLVLICVTIGATLNSLLAEAPDSNNWKSLEHNYAVANLQLAEARLAQATSQNKTVPDSVSSEMIRELKAGVQLAQGRIKLLDSAARENPYGPQIRATEDTLAAMQSNFDEANKANKIQADSVPEVQLRRAQASIDVAKARLAALKALDQQPPEVRIQWEIGQLQDQIRALWARPLIED